MANNLGFRVGLMLDHYFSDRRKKCYFFVNTDKIQSIAELKETLVEKFSLPSNVQLMHHGFLLLDEDTVFVVRQDEVIEVVPASPSKKKSSHKNKISLNNLDLTSETQLNSSDLKNAICGDAATINGRRDEISYPSVNCALDENLDYRVKKKKKRKHNQSSECYASVDISADDTSGVRFHSSPYNLEDAAKNSTRNKSVEPHWSPSSQIYESVVNFTKEKKSRTVRDSSKVESSASKKVDFNLNTKSCEEKSLVECDKSLKRKWKNEQSRLKYSGVAELIKQMQTSNENLSVENNVQMVNTEIDDADFCSNSRRKRIRRRKKRSRSKENSSIDNTLTRTFEETVLVQDVSFQSKARIHKRFASNEDVRADGEAQSGAFKTTNNEVIEESNLHSKLCSQISPLTPPSEHNSEDDVYKKLLDLKKLNKPVVFDRAVSGDLNNINDEERRLDGEEGTVAILPGFEKELNSESIEMADQLYCDDSEMQFEAPLNELRSLSNSDKEDASSSVETQKSESDSSKKETCPVHIKKNIYNMNLEKIDINNYPIIESTRKNDILGFKTLKLNENLSPSLSSLILARVMDVTGNLIMFEILSGKEEFDFSKDETIMEENKTLNPVINLNWTDLYEPRLLYP